MDELLQWLREQLEGKVTDDFSFDNFEAELKPSLENFVKEHTTGLVNNKTKLLAELKQAKADRAELQKKIDEVDFDEYIRLKEEDEERILNGNSGNDSSKGMSSEERENLKNKLQGMHDKKIKEKEAEIQQLQEKIGVLETDYHTTLKSNSLKDMFDKHRIADEHRDILEMALQGRALVDVADDGKREVMMKDEDGQVLPINDFFKIWSGTDKAKHYIKAPSSSGGGAAGGQGAGVPATQRQKLINAYNEAEKKGDARSMMSIKGQLANLQEE